jgi:hypothetical protein
MSRAYEKKGSLRRPVEMLGGGGPCKYSYDAAIAVFEVSSELTQS